MVAPTRWWSQLTGRSPGGRDPQTIEGSVEFVTTEDGLKSMGVPAEVLDRIRRDQDTDKAGRREAIARAQLTATADVGLATLDEVTNERIFRDEIVPKHLNDLTRQGDPEMVIIAAQRGAGKDRRLPHVPRASRPARPLRRDR